jgi:hypothetical protein
VPTLAKSTAADELTIEPVSVAATPSPGTKQASAMAMNAFMGNPHFLDRCYVFTRALRTLARCQGGDEPSASGDNSAEQRVAAQRQLATLAVTWAGNTARHKACKCRISFVGASTTCRNSRNAAGELDVAVDR